ncbi:MAG: hypothetical protein RLY97_1106 [Pseudomonadota bacterium]
MANLLVADDDFMFRELVRLKLEAVGHRVQVAADGFVALTATCAILPDLVILDNMMPVLSGPEVLREIKNNPETSHIPVIMLSARSREQDIVNALREGAADYITKPFIPDELTIRITRILAMMPRKAA